MHPLIVGNASAFWGDRPSAPRELVRGGPIHVLTADYLAELSMAILHRQRSKGAPGYVATFVRQLEEILAECIERGIKIVTNAGGLDPRGCGAAIEALATKLGVRARVAVVDGDDLSGRHDLLPKGAILTANVYLGSHGIRTALDRGADIVVTGRVTDAALVIGPAAWKFGWARDDWDRLASALVAGHVLECGTQATGGNYAFFREVVEDGGGFRDLGFPLAEIREDGSFVVTKHPGTGGLVSIGTVTAQMLYEIDGPRYASPDVVARFDTLELVPDGKDRVLVRGVRGEPPPPTSKVCVHTLGGFRNEMRVLISGPDVDEKLTIVERTLREALPGLPLQTHAWRTDRKNPERNEDALATLRLIAVADEPKSIGRAFSSRVVELATASVPGITLSAPPDDAKPFAGLRSIYIANEHVQERVTFEGETIAIDPPHGAPHVIDAPPSSMADDGMTFVVDEPTRMVPFGQLFGARSGDKGGDATLGVWARRSPDGGSPDGDAAWEFLRRWLATTRLKELLPETAPLTVDRHILVNLRAILFVVRGLLGEGVSSSTRIDPQAKTLGEWLRSRTVAVPTRLLPG